MKAALKNVEFSFHYEPETVSVRGNAMASGDDAADREVENKIIARLERGDILAWCCAFVTARLEVDGDTFEGTASLGACSYETEAELRHDCLEQYDLKDDAMADLKAKLELAIIRGAHAAEALKLLNAPVATDSREVPKTRAAADLAHADRSLNPEQFFAKQKAEAERVKASLTDKQKDEIEAINRKARGED